MVESELGMLSLYQSEAGRTQFVCSYCHVHIMYQSDEKEYSTLMSLLMMKVVWKYRSCKDVLPEKKLLIDKVSMLGTSVQAWLCVLVDYF